MENLSAFKILNLNEEFDIEDLDLSYYAAIKNSFYDQSIINNAYLELKNKVLRATLLCKINGFVELDKTIPIKIFKMQNKSKEEIEEEKQRIKQSVIMLAKARQWPECWYNVQFLKYFKSFE